MEKDRKNNFSEMTYKNFEDALEITRKLNIRTSREWWKYISSIYRNKELPSRPDQYYKNNGWIGWKHWLGTIDQPRNKRRYHVNDDYFKNFTSNMAYVLGFWYADGYMNKEHSIFSITQHKNDSYLLEKILIDMDSDYPVKKHCNNNLMFKITSPEIIKDIENIGGHVSKTFTIEFPKIPNEYLHDFIRGLWDGDGCITYQKNEKCYVSSFVSASKSFAYDLLDILRKEIKDFKGSVHFYNNIYMISCGVNDSRRLRDYMYKDITNDSLYLKRKYDKFVDSGDIKIAPQHIKFLSYEEAGEFIRTTGITNISRWLEYRKEHKINNIPSYPKRTYKEKYINWKTFIGL